MLALMFAASTLLAGPEAPAWRVQSQFGGAWAGGNADSVALGTNHQLGVRRGRHAVDLLGQVNLVRVGIQAVPGGPVVAHRTTTWAWWTRLRYDFRVHGRNALFAAFAADGNFRAGILWRVDPMAGVARTLVERGRHALLGDVGYAHTQERYVPGVMPGAGSFHNVHLGLRYDLRVDERVSFLQWAELFWAVDAPARVRVQSLTSLGVRLSPRVSVRLNLKLKTNSRPPNRPLADDPPSRYAPVDALSEFALAFDLK